MQPSLNSSIAVHADEVFSGSKISNDSVEFFKAIECCEEEVEVLGKGYVLNVTEANGNTLNVDAGCVGGGAEVTSQLIVEVLGVDNAVFSLPPLEELEIALELCQTVECKQVLLQLFTGQLVH